MKTLNDILAECTINRRVCPQPQQWNRLWESLPNRRRQGAGWEPPPPLILAAWHYSSDAEKRERLRVHLQWADEHGALEDVANLISNLTPKDWHTER